MPFSAAAPGTARPGLVAREIFPAVPLHVEYSLTAAGRSALEPVAALRAWAESQYPLARAATAPAG